LIARWANGRRKVCALSSSGERSARSGWLTGPTSRPWRPSTGAGRRRRATWWRNSRSERVAKRTPKN